MRVSPWFAPNQMLPSRARHAAGTGASHRQSAPLPYAPKQPHLVADPHMPRAVCAECRGAFPTLRTGAHEPLLVSAPIAEPPGRIGTRPDIAAAILVDSDDFV